MPRIKNRKHGKNKKNSYSLSSTHVIKVGWKAKTKDGREYPTRLRGFLICKEQVDSDSGRNIIDFEMMKELGYQRGTVEAAVQQAYRGGEDQLPTHLDFVITANAVRTEDGWDYPGTFAEELSCFNKNGLFCHGDGEWAWRKQEDGTRAKIECDPQGKFGVDPEKFCPYSCGGECKAHGRLVVALMQPLDKLERGKMPVYLGRGINYRFRFDTTSDANMTSILEALDSAADRLNGIIGGLPGSLQLSMRRKRLPDHVKGKDGKPVGMSIVPQITMTLNEYEISRRIAIHAQQLGAPEEPRAITYSPAPLGLEDFDPDAEAVETVEVEQEPEGDASIFDDLRADAEALWDACEPYARDADSTPGKIFSIVVSRDKKPSDIDTVGKFMGLMDTEARAHAAADRIAHGIEMLKRGNVPGFELQEVKG